MTTMSRFADEGVKWDRCALNALSSIATGGVIGLLLSTLIFKRKRWAFLLGVGYGIGMAYASCDYEVNRKVELPPCKKPGQKKGCEDFVYPKDLWSNK